MAKIRSLKASPGIDLTVLRAQLDLLDADLLDAIRRRIEQCQVIGNFKQQNGIAVMQPDRVGLVQERAGAYAQQHGLDPDFFRRLYELIIAEACRLEDLTVDAVDKDRA